MKVLHIISSIDPSLGGPIEGVFQLSSASKSRGHIVEIASTDSPDATFLASSPVQVHPLGPRSLHYGFSRSLVPWIRDNAKNYDVVVVNGIWQYHSFAVWRALSGSPTPYVVFTHGMLDPWFKRTYPLKHLKKWLYWPWAEYRVLRDAAAVIFTCQEERLLARQSFWLYKANEKVVNYGTAGAPSASIAHRASFFNQFPRLQNKRIAVFMGRLHPKKGCDLVLEAFAKTLALDPEWHLVMAGPDQVGWQSQLLAIAEQLGISNRVTWTGMITGDLKWGALQASEIFLLPSHQENFGIVVAEALSCELPVLISDQVNIWREIKNDGAGLVSADNLEGTVSMLSRWQQMTSQQRDAMRSRASQCFRERFGVQQASKSLLGVLNAVCQAGSAAIPPQPEVNVLPTL